MRNDKDNENSHSSMTEEVRYRVELARASNAVEGVELNEHDKAFMDAIPLDMSSDEFMKLAVAHVRGKRDGFI